MQKFIFISLSAGLLSACAMSADDYKIGTKNGEDYYALDVQGMGGPNKVHLRHWSEQICPQGYRVHEVKVDRVTPVMMAPGMNWWDVTIACPAQ